VVAVGNSSGNGNAGDGLADIPTRGEVD